MRCRAPTPPLGSTHPSAAVLLMPTSTDDTITSTRLMTPPWLARGPAAGLATPPPQQGLLDPTAVETGQRDHRPGADPADRGHAPHARPPTASADRSPVRGGDDPDRHGGNHRWADAIGRRIATAGRPANHGHLRQRPGPRTGADPALGACAGWPDGANGLARKACESRHYQAATPRMPSSPVASRSHCAVATPTALLIDEGPTPQPENATGGSIPRQPPIRCKHPRARHG